MLTLKSYQEKAVGQLLSETYALIARGTTRSKLVFKAPTGAGKTVSMTAYLHGLSQELPGKYELPRRRFAFIWIAPNQLHLQSYQSLNRYFGETRTIRPIQFTDISDKSLKPNELLFLNWQSISSDRNIYVRSNEQDRTLYKVVERTRLEDTGIIIILDEAHLFVDGEQAAKVLARLAGLIEIDVSATPYYNSDYRVTIHREAVVLDQMIKKAVQLNPALCAAQQGSDDLEVLLLKEALQKRATLAERYRHAGEPVNPLLLIQLPSEGDAETARDISIRNKVIAYLENEGITTANHKLAIWLSKEKTNLSGIETNDNLSEALLFKQAISLGWDCPRAAVLLIFREIKQQAFTIQTVGRILRMPQQKHYPDEALNLGYVYTDLSRDQIEIVADDMNYLVQQRADRKAAYQPVMLESAYINTRLVRNRLGSTFKNALYEAAEEYFGIKLTAQSTESHYFANAACMREKLIQMDVSQIEISVLSDVRLEAVEVGVTAVDREHQERFIKTLDELNVLFYKFCQQHCGDYARIDSAPVLELALKLLFEDYFQYNEYQAIKVILLPANTAQFVSLIHLALTRYARWQEEKATQATKQTEQYKWEVPDFRVFNDKYVEYAAQKHILNPTYLYRNSGTAMGDSRNEFEFIEFLEAHQEYLQWWYKNGAGNRSDFAVPYVNSLGVDALFYVDFIVLFSNGQVGLFDPKTENSDAEMYRKHNALLDFIRRMNHTGKRVFGGVIIRKEGVWKFCRNPISNGDDLRGWDTLVPQHFAS